jgi:hypothetical protein
MAWPQQDLTKGVNNPKTSQDTTKVKIEVMVEKSFPSFFTYAIIQPLNLCFASISFTYKTISLSICLCSFKKSKIYTIRLSLVIQELHNENKNVHTHSWHSKIKAHSASNT